MNESEARSALLVRAYEMAPPAAVDTRWTHADRDWATRAALQVEGEQASADVFLARRARLAAERLTARDRIVARLLQALTWRAWVGWAVALAAFAAGIATDAIGPAQRINVLAPPLLAILAWNLFVYAAMLLRTAARPFTVEARRPGPLARQLARVAHAATTARRVERLMAPLSGFARDWTLASAPLTAARVARIFHASAAALAAGALLGLYVRGIALEYRAGWESTFLDAASVHAFLSFVLAPAAALTGILLPDETALAALRTGVSPGENAARWIHLYGVTIAIFVLIPRLALALGQRLRERSLTRRFPLPLDDAYFRSLSRAHSGVAARIVVIPYSFRPSPQATLGLNALMTRVFGPQTAISVAPTVAFGEEDNFDPRSALADPAALVTALFALTATPEHENHGVFLDALAAHVPPAEPFVVLIDESAFRQRFGAAGNDARLDERRAAWHRMLDERGYEPAFIDLEHPDASDAEGELRAALERALARMA